MNELFLKNNNAKDDSDSQEIKVKNELLYEHFINDGYDGSAIPTMQFNEERLDLGHISPLDTPLVIYVEPSSFCNLSCTFCPQHISPYAINKQNM